MSNNHYAQLVLIAKSISQQISQEKQMLFKTISWHLHTVAKYG
jgi:hypothetical protein